MMKCEPFVEKDRQRNVEALLLAGETQFTFVAKDRQRNVAALLLAGETQLAQDVKP